MRRWVTDMASPWEGGSRPGKPSPSAGIADDLMARGNPCAARLAATGALETISNFIHAEFERRTDAFEIANALTLISAAIMMELISSSVEPSKRQAAARRVSDVWTALVVQGCSSDGGKL